MNWSEDEYNAFIGKKPKKKPKYHNKPKTVDGFYFPSQKEANYYSDLKLLHKAGEIKGFCRQARFPLLGCEYLADFIVWHNDGRVEVIDTKGVRTDTYIVKIKQFKELYPDIEFREV